MPVDGIEISDLEDKVSEDLKSDKYLESDEGSENLENEKD